MSYMDKIREMCQPGNVLRVYYDEGNPNNQLRHIRAIVDDELVVYKFWSGKEWVYRVEWLSSFDVLLSAGRLTLEKWRDDT